MEFELTQKQKKLRDEAAEFGATLDNDRLVKADLSGDFNLDLWKRCADYGLLGFHVPVEFGGRGYSALETVLAMEGFGYGCRDNGLVFGVAAQAFSVVDALVRFGTEDCRRNYLDGVIRGERIGCFAMTEADAGSDCFALEMTALPDGSGRFNLNGAKHLITFAPVADFALVFASTDPDAGKWGLTTFVVDADTTGYQASPVRQKMGLRTVPIGEIELTDCQVDGTAMLGNPGSGASLFNATQETERSFILAGQLGAMQRQLEETVAFARQRKQFGQSIGKFQSVSNRIVEMKLRLETGRLLLYQAAWLRDMNRNNMMEASLTNWHLAEAFLDSSLDALRIRGGRGFLTDHEVERDVRDAMGAPLYGGTSDIQKQIVAGLLGL